MKKALTIAGSDTSGGAGIQADLKTFQELKVYGMTALTSIVAMDPQNDWAHQVLPIDTAFIKAQLATVLAGIGVDAVKTGMLPTAEIIELHHNQKKDAPSGTAIKTAQMMAEANKNLAAGNCEEVETIAGARGGKSYSDIRIHSVRMPGYIASQELLFGASGQIMSIRHDSMDRKCYMPGVLMAVKHVFEKNDFVYGLEKIMT